MTYSETPFFFGSQGLYGVLTEPEMVLGSMVVVTGFGEEKKSAYRNVVDICRHSVQNGIVSLRFDLRGTGDSDYPFKKLALADWSEDVRTAYNYLADRFKSVKHHVVAMRLGCLLTMTAGLNPDSTVLVAPPASGRHYMREELLRKQLRAAISGMPRVSNAEFERELRDNGTADLDGVEFPSGLYKEIAATRYTASDAGQNVSAVYFANRPEPPADVLSLATQISAEMRFHGIAAPPFWSATDYQPVPQLSELITELCMGR